MLAKLLVSLLLCVASRAIPAQDSTPLALDTPLQRDLSGGQSHSYQVNLGANQFLNLVVEQRGIAVEVTLLGLDGKPLLTVDGPAGNLNTKPLSFVSERNGNYPIIVKAPDAKARPGSYQIRVLALRPATPEDQVIATAYQQFRASRAWLTQKKNAEAIALEETLLTALEQRFAKDAARLLSYPHNVVHWYANLLSNKGGRTADSKGDFTAAEGFYLRALALLESKFGQDSLEVASVSNDLGAVYYDHGDYPKVAQLFQRALTIKQKLLPPDSFDLAIAFTNLAAVFYIEGDYFRSEPLYQQAKTIWEKLGRKEVFQALNGLAIINLERGDYEQAETQWQKVSEIIDSISAQPSQSKAIILSNLAGLYERKGDLTKAEIWQLRALEMRQQTFSPEHPEVAISLNRLGNIYYQKGDLAKAEDYCTQGLNLLKKKVGDEHPNVAFSLHHLAKIAQAKGDTAKAEALYQEALKLRTKLLGPKHPELAEMLGEMALLYRGANDTQKSFAYQAQTNEINEALLKRNLLVGSERQKLRYLALFSDATNATLGLHVQALPASKEAASLAMETILRSKGRGLDAMSDSIATFRRHATTEQQTLFDRLASARSQLAHLTLRGLSGKPEAYQAKLKQHETEIDQLEAELSRRSAEFSVEAQPITLPRIQALLPSQTSLIEFATYQPYQPTTKTFAPLRYVAYVLSADGTLQWKDLGEAARIDKAVENLRLALRDPKRDDAAALSRQLDEQVMQPLRALLGEAKHLLISPDGMLNLLPFAALVDEQKRYLVERYTVSYLTSGRDLLRLQTKAENQQGPLVMADPDFGGQGARATKSAVTTGRAFDLSKAYFSPLPGTAEEAVAIKAILSQATILTKAQATKTALKEARSPFILHIATHGFFFEDVVSQTTRQQRELQHTNSGAVPTGGRLENPLLRSGLGLAGANLSKSGANDGILTALEAAGLNLWGTKLVVLSACDTGVGEVKNGEGVYGLRRALVLAGAETQVMSLWPVADVATRDLMIAYYQRLQQGVGRGEALRQVQLALLQKKNRQHPFYWAGFIQSGEWANLAGKR